LDGLSWSDPSPPSALIVLVYQWEAGFLQGIALRRGVPPSQEGFDGIAAISRLRARGRILGRVATKFVGPFLRMFLFQGCPHLPFFLVSRAARVESAVAFPFCAGALREGILEEPFQEPLSSFLAPFSGLPGGERILSKRRVRPQLAYVSFEAADLWGSKLPEGHLTFPAHYLW
jgi:hypothetical protein